MTSYNEQTQSTKVSTPTQSMERTGTSGSLESKKTISRKSTRNVKNKSTKETLVTQKEDSKLDKMGLLISISQSDIENLLQNGSFSKPLDLKQDKPLRRTASSGMYIYVKHGHAAWALI